MKNLRCLLAALAACLLTVVALASDPSGTWQWTMTTPNGSIDTTLHLAAKDGQLTGTYSNSYGEGPISAGSIKDDVIAFKVERDFDGNKFVLQYDGKVTGDAIKGTIQFPGMNGGDAQKLEWNAKRASAPKS